MSENKLVLQWKQFIQTDASSGIILVIAAILALFMANSFFSANYNAFLEFPVSITLGTFAISKPLVLWVNDGLMALFFFVVGLEIKRELFYGQLSSPDQVVMPFLAAIAGIVFYLRMDENGSKKVKQHNLLTCQVILKAQN